METGTKEMMEKLQGKPSRQELEANIKIAHNWMTAVRGGTYQGHQTIHIATLLDFLERQHSENVKRFDAEFAVHPEWAKKEDGKPVCSPCAPFEWAKKEDGKPVEAVAK